MSKYKRKIVKKKIRQKSFSPLAPYRLRMNSDRMILRGCFTQITNICISLNMIEIKEQLLEFEAKIKYQLINEYNDKKRDLISLALYPKEGEYDQRKIDRLKKNSLI